MVGDPVLVFYSKELHSLRVQSKRLLQDIYLQLSFTHLNLLSNIWEGFLDAIVTGQKFELVQPNFHSGNWSRMLADADDRLKYVRVMDGVASVFDKFVLIRHDLGGAVPDGFYLIDRKTLIRTQPPACYGGSRYSWPNNEYPDIEACNPDFATLSVLGKIDRASAEIMMSIADRVRRREGDIRITPDGISLRQHDDPELRHRESFGFTPDDLEIYVKGSHFCVAMTELLRYDYSYFMIRRYHEDGICLVFGHNWNNCVLVTALGMNRHGQHLR